MDDANVPSLMSIPYLGYNYDPDIYANTRRFILSHDNPTYQSGTNAATTGILEGYGSPHMSKAIRNNIWPMSLAVQGLSSSNVAEKKHLVNQLVQSTGGTGWMHESIDVSNPKKFTRRWFCWADSLFAELVMTLSATECPTTKYKVMSWRDPVQVTGGKFAA
jgi:meiotically up-regulated gene 157 (Mug157) protein